MEDYEGPVMIRLKQTHPKKKKVDPSKVQFSQLPKPITHPMDGFSKYTTSKSFFDIPRTTSVTIEDLDEVNATFIPEPEVTSTLKLSRLNLKGKGKGYTVDEIKAVLHLRGVYIPSGTRTKEHYIELAKASGAGSDL